MSKINPTHLSILLLICLVSILAFLPSRASASFPLGLTLTPTPTQEPPTPTATQIPPTATQIPPTNTPQVPTVSPTSPVLPPPPTPASPTPEPKEPKEPKPTQTVLLPLTGDYPSRPTQSGLIWLGILAILLLSLAAGLVLGIGFGPAIRKWLG